MQVMVLTVFLKDLLDKGVVTVAGDLKEFSNEDLKSASKLLKEFYEEDVLEMPHTAPEFMEEAAIWALRYLYSAVQLALLRNLDEEDVQTLLKDYEGEINPEVIYSVDLTFRYLTDLLNLAKGLAPEDILVRHLKNIAAQWPFSSVGLEFEGIVNHDLILQNPSLKYAYADRIIREKDTKRVSDKAIAAVIEEVLGSHIDLLWPKYQLIKKEKAITI